MASLQHHRTRDHFGTQDDTTVVLSSDIGRYAAGSTVAAVLADMVARLDAGSSTNVIIGTFNANAALRPWRFYAYAALFKAGFGAGSFTADARLGVLLSISATSVLKGSRSGSLTADAYLVP